MQSARSNTGIHVMRHLITSALPYINGIKHLGNLTGSLLPADIHVRYLRQIGEDAIFISGTDEHGTPAELGAAADGVSPREYCDIQHARQAETYRGFDLSFDHFGRTSSPVNHDLVQKLYRQLDDAGFIEERETLQIYSVADGRFLPDRYVVGTCPHCGGAARGDQCDVCSTTLDPTDLVDPRSAISGSTDLEVRSARHLFLRQSALAERLSAWLDTREGWPSQVLSIGRGWLAQGLQDRCITRNLSWGVKVPREGFEDTVFYVWFDAPVGYIAATAEWCERENQRLEDWWSPDADVAHVQFLAKDNVPFHVVSFPATLIGAGGGYRTADVIKGVNWLTYEGGKFSTSSRRGVFLDQALELLPADHWRWWLAANSPEGADVDFDFARFAAGSNGDLCGKFGNLATRITSFVHARNAGVVPVGGAPAEAEAALAEALRVEIERLAEHHAAREIRKAADRVRAIWDIANAYVAQQAPWTLIKTDPERAAVVTRHAIGLVRICSLIAHPFIPSSSRTVLDAVGGGDEIWPTDVADILDGSGGLAVARIDPPYRKLDDAWVAEQTTRFAGHD